LNLTNHKDIMKIFFIYHSGGASTSFFGGSCCSTFSLGSEITSGGYVGLKLGSHDFTASPMYMLQ